MTAAAAASPAQFAALAGDTSLQQLLLNPHLQQLLVRACMRVGAARHPDPGVVVARNQTALDRDAAPQSRIDGLLQLPIFQEYADACLRVLGAAPGDSAPP